jgi:hypothetical protein
MEGINIVRFVTASGEPERTVITNIDAIRAKIIQLFGQTAREMYGLNEKAAAYPSECRLNVDADPACQSRRNHQRRRRPDRCVGRLRGLPGAGLDIALAVLMPIVASMGGIAGSQTLTLVIRGLALGQLERDNTQILLWKVFGIAALNGVIWAAVVAALAIAWFGDWQIGGIIAAAILLNLLCAAVAG